MWVRDVVLSGFCAAALFWPGAVLAEEAPARDYLSYYTYHRTDSEDTVSGIAARFGLAESSLIRMNPYLEQYGDDLVPKGTLVCVPQDKDAASESALLAEKDEEPEVEDEVEGADEATATKRRKRRKLRDEPSEKEWETLADLATKGAPSVADRSPVRGAPSRMITSDGRVVYVPAARPNPAPVSRSKTSRGKLSSRKGLAIHGLLKSCRSYMGTPYVWGGEQPGGFDCSGYVQYVYGKHGIHLPRTADIQYNVGRSVKRGEERPGDLVFFETYAPGASHVGVYLGRGYFIHASSSRGVTIDRLNSDFFAQRYLGAKRNI